MLDLSARKVYGALEDGISAIDAKVDNAILSIYKAGGSLEFDDLPSPSSDVANMAYLVTDAFTTTSDFVEGAGVDYPAGTYVAIVNTGTEDDPDYKYDVVPFTMVVDDTMSAVSENPLQNKVITEAVQEIRLDISNLSASKISKSETVGHVMNDGSIDENDYAEKVENATSGHLAGLDSNGNLTDSGVSPTEDVTVEGNPVTFDSPFEQDAKNVVVSVKPIQAGSGTPSPENIRPISGIDEVEIGVSGKNYLPLTVSGIKSANPSASWSGNSATINSMTFTIDTDDDGKVTGVKAVGTPNANTVFFFCHIVDMTDKLVVGGSYFIKDAEASDNSTQAFSGAFTVPSTWHLNTVSAYKDFTANVAVNTTLYPQLELGSVATAFEPYIEPTTTTIPLPSTLYDGTVRVDEGSADGTKDKIVLDGSDDEDWRQSVSVSSPDRRVFYPYNLFPNSKPAGNDSNVNLVSMSSNMYDIGTTSYYDIVQMTSFAIGIGGGVDGATIGVNVDGAVFDTLADFKAWLAQNPLEVCYELATPTTLSFDPADVELLEGTNVVSTNAEKVAVTYGRSLWQDINDLKTDTEGKLDKSDVATIEGDTASKAYSVNDFMLRSDGFYKVTQPIAQNASITASNTTKTTIGAVLTALLNS